jgi:hypothetical protein
VDPIQLDGREVRASTGTEDREQAEELERHARDSVWRQVKLGEKPPYLWSDARKRWLIETRKRTKAKDEEILSWFDKHLKRHTMQDITRPVVEHLRVLRAEESSKATADRYMALLRASLFLGKRSGFCESSRNSAPMANMSFNGTENPLMIATRRRFKTL